MFWRRSRFVSQPRRSPVIILGNQKSGTSAIASLLADFSGSSRTLDIPATWPPNFGRLMRQEMSIAELVRKNALAFSKDVVKEPNLSFFATELRECFPDARFVFVLRDPRDNIRSILNRLGIRGDLAANPATESIPKQWREVFVPTLLQLPSSCDHYTDVLAHRWARVVQGYLTYEGATLLIQYEDFLKDKCGAIADLASRLGLAQNADIRDKVDVRYQPSGDNSVTWEEFFGEGNLSAIEVICGHGMQRFGYHCIRR